MGNEQDHLHMLGVRDMERSVRFYRDRLGFRTDCVEDSPRVCFFDTPGTKFELYPLDLLAEDICPDGPPVVAEGFGGITLKKLGFTQLGTIPGGFRMPDGSYADICPYYHEL